MSTMTDHQPKTTQVLATGFRLSKFKEHKGLSQETTAYSAVITKDGKPFAAVSNDGHGGEDMIRPLPRGGVTQHEAYAQIEAAAQEVFGEDSFARESFLGELLGHALTVAMMNRKRSIMFVFPEDGDFWTEGVYRVAPTSMTMEELRRALLRQKPEAKVWDKNLGDFVTVSA